MYVVDRIRIEDFRQLKREIRGSADHLIVGIDVGKKIIIHFLVHLRARPF